MKKLGLGVLVLVGLGVGGYLWANSQFTACYAVFNSRAAAERAADAGRDAGLDPYVEHRASDSAVTFSTGETGEDARKARQAYREIVRRARGRLGHPDGGCLERKQVELGG